QSSASGVLDLARTGALSFDGNGNLTLAELVNLGGIGAQPPQGGGLTGNYQIDPTGRVIGSLNNSGGTPLNLVMYAVSGSDVYVLQPDQILEIQTSGTVSLQH